MAGVCTGEIKAKELDSPLARGASMIRGTIPATGAATAESLVGSRKEAEEGYQSLDIGGMITVGVGVEG
jgi:hypothetical protein